MHLTRGHTRIKADKSGVVVCDAWIKSFPAFLQYIGLRPGPSHSIDRWPNKNGNYEPGNVRWATKTEQARNTRSNRTVDAFGRTLLLSEWAEETGIGLKTIHQRLEYGWTSEEAVGTPIMKSRRGGIKSLRAAATTIQ